MDYPQRVRVRRTKSAGMYAGEAGVAREQITVKAADGGEQTRVAVQLDARAVPQLFDPADLEPEDAA